MNYILALKTFVAGTVAAAIVLSVTPHAAAYASETAGFSIAGGTYTADGTFPMTVYEDSGDAEVNAVVLDLQYDATKLELVEVGSAPAGLMNFPTPPEVKQGTVLITRTSSSFGSLQGKQTFAVLKFRALVSTGTTAVTIGPRSEIYSMQSAQNIWDGNTLGATIAFAAATPQSTARLERSVPPQRAVSPTPSKATKQAAATQPADMSTRKVEDAPVHGPVTVSIIGSNTSSNNHVAIATASAVAACLAAVSGYSILTSRAQRRHPAHHRSHAKNYHKTQHKKLRRKHA